MDPLHLLREQARKYIGELMAHVLDAEAIVRQGSLHPAIVDAALELNCQMIVMGMHGPSGLANTLLGSVAEYVGRQSKVPVLTVRCAGEPTECAATSTDKSYHSRSLLECSGSRVKSDSGE
jgi:nucleotide-binding universal stress UspA family protein